MTREEVLEALKDILVELLGVERQKVTEEANFEDDLDADSLARVEIVMAIEDKFDIKIPEEKTEGVTTVGKAIDLILELLAEAPAPA